MTEVLLNTISETSGLNEVEINKLFKKHIDARNAIELANKEAENLNRKIPIELLALEWLTKLDSSSETKTYLLENFMPILVLGCEKILKEAFKKKLIEKKEIDPNFNPINRLAQFLIRNNPKSVNHCEISPYVRTLREVYQELRDQLYSLQGNKLATVKENVRKRRTERENLEKLQLLEISKRRSHIDSLFDKFNVPINGRLEFSMLIECLKFYKKFLVSLPASEQKNLEIKPNFPQFCYKRDNIYLDKRLMKNEFSEIILFLTEQMDSINFENFCDFIEQCSIYFVNLANMNNFKKILDSLLIMLDSTNTGYLSRRRILKLLKDFKERDTSLCVKDPLEWPVLDPFIKFENKLEQLIPTTERMSGLSNEFLTSQVLTNQVPEKELEPTTIDDNKPGIEKQSQENNSENEKSADEKHAAEDKQLENTELNEEKNLKIEEKSEKEEVDQNSIEKIKQQENNNDNPEDNSEEVKNPVEENFINRDIVEKLENEPIELAKSFQNDVPMIKDLKENSSNLNEIIQSNLSLEEELLFLKGGNFYYTPIENTFQMNLLNQIEEESNNFLIEFDPEFINSRQFRNLMSTYVSDNFLDSEIYVNNLIVYLKDNYAESRFEKNSKQNKKRNIKQEIYRNKKYTSCFEKLDNEGSGQLSLSKIELALQDFKDGLFNEQIKNSISLTRSEISSNGKFDDFINRNEFFDLISVLVGLVDFPKFEDQLLNYLSCLNTYDVNEKTRGEVRKKWLSQIKYVGDITCGSFEPLFKQLFFTLLKDAENHGLKNGISAYIGILERLEDNSIGLKFIATTPHDSKFVLGKSLTRNDQCISFEVIDSAMSKLVENVCLDENVFHFNSAEKRDGSFVLFPLKYARNKVFGTIGIDTLQNSNNNSNFADHELSFYQGLANEFAVSYAHIIFKNRLIKTCFSAIQWLRSRCNGIDEINVYFVQIVENESNLLGTEENFSNQNNDKLSLNLKPIIKFNRKNDQLINVLNETGYMTEEILEKNYGSKAYECATVSESTVEHFNGKFSYYAPLRNEEHKAVLVIEITSEEHSKNVEKKRLELPQIENVLYILHKCQEELLDEHFIGLTNKQYEFESSYEQDKFDILYEKKYINFICEKLREHLGTTIETEGSENIIRIIKFISVLVNYEEFEQKKVVDEILIDKMLQVDSTSKNFTTTSKSFDLLTDESIKDLNQITEDVNGFLVKLFLDFGFLLKDLRTKSNL